MTQNGLRIARQSESGELENSIICGFVVQTRCRVRTNVTGILSAHQQYKTLVILKALPLCHY